MSALLAAADLHTHYGDSHVLRGVGLSLAPGTALGLLGRNGMGKTTLIRSVMGYVRATSGRVAWQGEDVSGQPPERMARRGIGYVPVSAATLRISALDDSLVWSSSAGGIRAGVISSRR